MKKIKTKLGYLYYFRMMSGETVLLDSDKKPISRIYLYETIKNLKNIKTIYDIANIVVFKPIEWSLDTPLTYRLGDYYFAFKGAK